MSLLKPPDQESNPRSFSFQSKASANEDMNTDFLEQFEEAIAERDQRIEALELQLEAKEHDFLEQIKSYESKILAFKPEMPEDHLRILKVMELHNQKLEDLLLSCEKLDLKGLVSIEKQINQEDFYGIDALKRGFEDRLARVSSESKRYSIEMNEKLKKLLLEKEDLEKELKRTRDRENQLKAENSDLKQKVLDLNNKVFELNLTVRNQREKSEFSKNLSENLSRNLIESISSKLSSESSRVDSKAKDEGLLNGKVAEKILNSQEKLLEETSLLRECMRKIETYAKSEKQMETDLAAFKEKLNLSEQKTAKLEADLRDKEEIIRHLDDLRSEEVAKTRELEAQIAEERKACEGLMNASPQFHGKGENFESELTKYQETIFRLETEAKGYEQKILALENEKNQQKQKTNENQEKSRLLEKKIEELNEKIRLAEDKLRKNANQEAKVRELTARLKGEQAKIEDLRIKAELYDELNSKELGSQKKIEDLESELSGLNGKIASSEAELSRFDKEKALLEGKISRLQNENGERESEITRLKLEIAEFSERIERLTRENTSLTELTAELKVELEKSSNHVSTQKSETQKELDKLKTKNEDLRTKLSLSEAKYREVSDQKARFTSRIAELEKKVSSGQLEINEKTELIQKFIEEKQKLESSIKNFEAQVKRLKDENHEILNEKAKESSGITKKINDLEASLGQMSGLKSRLESENSKLLRIQQENSQKVEKMLILEEKLRNLIEENAKLVKMMDLKEANIQSLLKENKSLKVLEEKIAQLQGEIDFRNAEIEALEQKNAERESALHELSSGIEQRDDKLAFLRESLHSIQLELSKLKNSLQEVKSGFSEKLAQCLIEFKVVAEKHITSYLSLIQQKNEEKMLLFQRIYDKKEASYRGNYEVQISRLEKDLEGLTKSFKEETSFPEKTQQTSRMNPTPPPFFLNTVGPASVTVTNSLHQIISANLSPNQSGNHNKAEFINYLGKKAAIKNKALEKAPAQLYNSQHIPDYQNAAGKVSTTVSLTPKSQQSGSVYLWNGNTNNFAAQNTENPNKRNFCETYPNTRYSPEGTQREVWDLKKSLSILHDEHQKLLEVVESTEKNNKLANNDQFAVRCFEKLFDQLAVSLERESQLRVMAQMIEEKLSRSSVESQKMESLLSRLDDKDNKIKSLEQENAQYKSLCKELQIQLDFKRAQMKFVTQNAAQNPEKNAENSLNMMASPTLTSSGNIKRFVEVKRDFSATHNHARNSDESETVPNVSITYQRPQHFANLKSPKTPTKVWGKEGKGLKDSARKTEKGKTMHGQNQRWV